MSSEVRSLAFTIRELGQLRRWLMLGRDQAISRGFFGSQERREWEALFRSVDAEWKVNRRRHFAAHEKPEEFSSHA